MKSAYSIDRILGRDDSRVSPRDDAWQTILPRDLSDCLLEAYDVVASHAAALMRENGMLDPRRELWMRAEREILGEIAVDMQVTDASVTALASLPEFGGREITLGLEPRWMVVFARRHGDGDGDGHGVSWREKHGDGHAGGSGGGPGGSRRRGRGGLQRNRPRVTHGPRYAFCSIEFPEEVDPAKCCAVFHDGLLGVRVLRRR